MNSCHFEVIFKLHPAILLVQLQATQIMVFSSLLFIFIFLPIVLACCSLPGKRLRNVLLLVFSLLFYAWGEVSFILLMVASTFMNYVLGLLLDKYSDNEIKRRWIVAVSVILNIGILAYFKYSNFLLISINDVMASAGETPIKFVLVRLPIGISFFTFHAISYIMDVYRRKWPSAKNPMDLALYIFFFPQLIAGPILRWSAIAPQIANRVTSYDKFADGIQRFIQGLAKKMMIANTLAVPADQIFALPASELSPLLTWFGVLCYSLQIYFDFSGYSDMAVGLGKMFGFQFIENFNYPYISQSVREFWRRWHISLSTWFRDYLYIPLGGNRCSNFRSYFNLFIVFFLCGLWHGASWTFVIWGMYYGLFLILERTAFGTFIDKLWCPFRHLYTILIIMIGWVFFRAETLSYAMVFLRNMAGYGSGIGAPIARYLNNQVLVFLILGILISTPLWPNLKDFLTKIIQKFSPVVRTVPEFLGAITEVVLLGFMLIYSTSSLAGGTFNPFIYFRF